jgi:hypothetical protein
MPHKYTVQFKYEHRKLGTEGRTLRVQGSSIQVAIGKATREFVKSLDRKERFDCQKGLSITAARVQAGQDAPPEFKSVDSPVSALEEAD